MSSKTERHWYLDRSDPSPHLIFKDGQVAGFALVCGITGSFAATFVPLQTADIWLHLVFGAGMILLGVIIGRRITATGEARG